MKNLLNRYVFDQVDLDSGVLVTKSSIVHSVHEPGEYQGYVIRGSEAVGFFSLTVSDRSEEKQVAIDLYKFETGGARAKNRFMLSPRGYCVFHVSGGEGGYTVSLFQNGEQKARNRFDSRYLKEGDIFTATLIRPGVYAAVNENDNSHMEIIVPYPKRVKSRPFLKPLSVKVSSGKMLPEKLEAQAGCAIVFHITTGGRIRVGLKRPIDRPDLFRTPEDVPRSVERRVLAVINSVSEPKFLAGLLDTGKGEETNRKLAENIMFFKEKNGKVREIGRLFALEKLRPEEMSAVINSLEKAYGRLTDHSRFRRKRQ